MQVFYITITTTSNPTTTTTLTLYQETESTAIATTNTTTETSTNTVTPTLTDYSDQLVSSGKNKNAKSLLKTLTEIVSFIAISGAVITCIGSY